MAFSQFLSLPVPKAEIWPSPEIWPSLPVQWGGKGQGKAGSWCWNPWPVQRVQAAASIQTVPIVQSNRGLFWINVSGVHKAYDPLGLGLLKVYFIPDGGQVFGTQPTLINLLLRPKPLCIYWNRKITLFYFSSVSTDVCYLLEPFSPATWSCKGLMFFKQQEPVFKRDYNRPICENPLYPQAQQRLLCQYANKKCVYRIPNLWILLYNSCSTPLLIWRWCHSLNIARLEQAD